MLIAAFFIITKKGKHPKCPSAGKQYSAGYFYRGILYSHEKQQAAELFSNMDGSHGY